MSDPDRQQSETSSPAFYAPESGQALWTAAFVRLLAASSAYGFSFSCFILLPKYLVTAYDAGPAELGLVSGTFGVAAVAATALVGSCIDRCRRRDLMAAAAAINALAGFGFMFVDEIGLSLYGLRFLQGAAFAMSFSAAPTLAAELAPAAHLGRAVGLAGASMLIMNAVAPAVGERLAAAAGWNAVFALSSAAAIASFVLVCGIREESPASRQSGPVGFLAVARRPEARRAAAVVSMSGTGFGAMFTFLAPYAMELGRSDVGGFFVAYATVATGVRFGFGGLGDRFGHGRTATVALTLYAGVVGSVLAFDPARMELTGAALGLAHGVFHPTMIARLLSRARPSERGRLMAVFAGAFNAGCWLGGLALGAIAELAGYQAAFGAAAFAVSVGVLVLAVDEHERVAAPVVA